ncbi:hypothetical protein AB6A40_006609 [Gnathostoma spinigerum]|uniref:Patched domain containing 3 n=1 Tax=Gnathostoma spinigerum TaxID=75299 RepID=A0ABD6EK19_9BILA
MYIVCCARVICFLFISSTRTVLISLLTISSIFIGIFGLLSFWDVNIDPISMSIITVSIGLSVDYPAHLIYHFYHSATNSETTLPVAKRLAKSLNTMGFPVLQCSVSIVIIVYSTLFVKCYLSEVQVKIISLLVVLSVIHTMVVVPVFLCAATSVHSNVCGLASKNSQIKPFSIMNC